MAKQNMLFDDDDEMNNSPVSDYREKVLECVLEESGSTTANCDRGNKAKGDEGDAWNSDSPRHEVLSVQGKRVVVRDTVLHRSVN